VDKSLRHLCAVATLEKARSSFGHDVHKRFHYAFKEVIMGAIQNVATDGARASPVATAITQTRPISRKAREIAIG